MDKPLTAKELMRRRDINRAYREYLAEAGEKPSMEQACAFAAKYDAKNEREVIMILERRLPFGF